MEIPLWFSNLVLWSVQVALLVLAAGFLARVLKLQQPRVLLTYWRSLFALSLLLPVIQPWHRSQNVAATLISSDFGVPLPPPSRPAPAHWHLPSLQSLVPILGVAILLGIALRFAILALGLLKLRRIRQASLPIDASAESTRVLQAVRLLLATPAEFRFSAQVGSPVTFGFFAPIVLLPERFATLDPRFQSAIACHELLHVRRRDWAHHLGEEVLRALFWFHPAIAWLISRVRLAREQVVDLEVVRLTNARKSYLEALLEFTNARTSLAAIPAPPFLAERQLVERVSLMLKEVRMSQRRLIVSLALISSCLALVIALAAWTFPLKAQGVAGSVIGGVPGGVAHGVSGGVAGGVPNGIAGEISGGISGGISTRPSSEEPSVDISTIWTDKVKRGPMLRQVRGMGTLSREGGSGNFVVKAALPTVVATDVRPNQDAAIDTGVGLVKGHVISVNPGSSEETRTVNLTLDGPLPPKFEVRSGAGNVAPVTATIDIELLNNVLSVGRPVNGRQNSETSLFKIVSNGAEAVRTQVKLGRASVNGIEVLDGLNEGDKVVLSDMSSVANAERIRLTDENHIASH